MGGDALSPHYNAIVWNPTHKVMLMSHICWMEENSLPSFLTFSAFSNRAESHLQSFQLISLMPNK